ncbi:MAG: efflux RND transporter periplasmic adaptor subunit [Gemmataceae bacterium]
MSTTINSTNPPASLLTPRTSLAAKKLLNALPIKAASRRRWRTWVWLMLALPVLGLSTWGIWHWVIPHDKQGNDVLATVARGELPIVVTEKGDLESSDTQEVRCPVETNQIKVVEIKPEGVPVKKGEIVVTLDKDELGRRRAEQEVKWSLAVGKEKAAEQDLEVNTNKADKELADANLAVILAELDLEKYEDKEGDFHVEENKKLGAIKLAEKDLQEAKEKLDGTITLVKKGSATLEQKRARELEVAKAEFLLEVSRGELLVLQKFTRRRQIAELQAKAENARREKERVERSRASTIAKFKSEHETAKQTANIEKDALERVKAQLGNCDVKSPADGILVYSKNRWFDPSSQIRQGAMVSFQQPLFSIPDLANLQVKVKIHESKVKKIKVGQKAEIRLESDHKLVMHGTVTKLATLANTETPWMNSGVKHFDCVIRIDDLPPDAALKPGVTAEVKILVNHYSDVLLVPIQSVTEIKDKHYVYVFGPQGVERREIEVGENNDKFIEIKDGLEEGERVTMDARTRGAEESKDKEEKPPETKPAEPPPQPTVSQPAPG